MTASRSEHPAVNEARIIWILWLTYGAFYFCRQNLQGWRTAIFFWAGCAFTAALTASLLWNATGASGAESTQGNRQEPDPLRA
jgi:hypothetical protein